MPRPAYAHVTPAIFEAPWSTPRQHAHLRPAFNLKNADRVGFADHVVDGGVLGGDGGQRESRSRLSGRLVLAKPRAAVDQIEALMNRRQHAEAEAIDF